MKKFLMIFTVLTLLSTLGGNNVYAQSIGQNAKALGVQIFDSIKSKTPVLIDSIKSKTPVLIDSIKSKAPVVRDSIVSKGSRAGDKAAVVADTLFTRGKRWIERRNKQRGL